MDQQHPRLSDSVETALSRRRLLGSVFGFLAFAHPFGSGLFAAVETQPLIAQVRRLVEAMAYLGEPLSDADRKRITRPPSMTDRARAVEEVQRVLDPRCLLSHSHQSGEPDLGGPGRRAGATGRAGMACVSRQSPQ